MCDSLSIKPVFIYIYYCIAEKQFHHQDEKENTKDNDELLLFEEWGDCHHHHQKDQLNYSKERERPKFGQAQPF